jgi:hypothetical protein
MDLAMRQEEASATDDQGSKQAKSSSRVHGRDDRHRTGCQHSEASSEGGIPDGEEGKGKGPEGVLHGNRNKESPRRVPEVLWKESTDPALGKYRHINDTLLCEILRKAEGIVSGREKLRSILRKNLRRSSLGHESQGHSL